MPIRSEPYRLYENECYSVYVEGDLYGASGEFPHRSIEECRTSAPWFMTMDRLQSGPTGEMRNPGENYNRKDCTRTRNSLIRSYGTIHVLGFASAVC